MADEAEDVRLTLRLPPALRDRINQEAGRSGRSLNAEIVTRLEESFGPTSEQKIWDNIHRIDELIEKLTDRMYKAEGYFTWKTGSDEWKKGRE